MTDDLDDLLAPTTGPPDPTLHAAIRKRTTRVVVRRKWLRRGKVAGAAACLVLFGGVAGWTAKPVAAPLPPRTEYVAVPVPVVLPAIEAAPPSAERFVSADQLEIQAELAPDPAATARLYRLAGDRYLTAEPGEAARCYRLFLIHAGPDERAVSPADSWLLMALKSSHSKEQDRAAKQGI